MIDKKTKNGNIATLITCHVVGFLFVVAFGAFAHNIAKAFPNAITQVLLPCNYSLGEQTKLLVTPILIVFTVEYFIVGKRIENFIPAHLIIGICLPIISLGIYHVHEFLFKSPLSVDGPHIILAVSLYLAAFLASILLTLTGADLKRFTKPAFILYLIVIIAFAVFSFAPPHGLTFYDTVRQVYGPIFY